MSLPQTLQPNERGVAVYTDGIFQGYEDIVTLSDEELAVVAKTEDIKVALGNIKDANTKKVLQHLMDGGA